MKALQFQAICGEHSIHPKIAMENERVSECWRKHSYSTEFYNELNEILMEEF